VKSNRSLLVGGGLLAAGSLYYLRNPGRSVATAFADLGALVTGSISLSAAQREMASVISREFGTAGFGWLANAAIANAYAESRLDPAAISGYANEDSVGLFQLNAKGAGKGMTTAQRQDPVLNTRRILDEVRAGNGSPVRAARGRATHAELASLFARHIERCWACGYGGGDGELVARHELVTKLFGSQVAATVPA
jgi:hypothetical protein